jgi:membrane-associated phospholipid phosphatase
VLNKDEETARAGQPAAGSAAWWLWLAAALLLIAAGFLGLDRWFYERVSCALETKYSFGDRDFYTVTRPFWLVCRFAFGYGLAGLVVFVWVILRDPRGWPRYTAALLGVVAAALLSNLAQGAIGRLRPDQADTHLAFKPAFSGLLDRHKVSFPSGEVAAAFGLACMLTRLWPRLKLAFYAAGALAGLARLVNGAHYFSDVVGGALVGILVSDAVFRMVVRHGEKVRAAGSPQRPTAPTRESSSTGERGDPARW